MAKPVIGMADYNPKIHAPVSAMDVLITALTKQAERRLHKISSQVLPILKAAYFALKSKNTTAFGMRFMILEVSPGKFKFLVVKPGQLPKGKNHATVIVREVWRHYTARKEGRKSHIKVTANTSYKNPIAQLNKLGQTIL